MGSWGIQPSEFWRMRPLEWAWLAEAKRGPIMYGKLTEQEVAELYREQYGEPG